VYGVVIVATVKKYNLSGNEIGNLEINSQLTDAQANSQMIKDYIVALRQNERQWSANTKGRSEVKHTTAKPYRQKGTGRARQGSLVAPQYRGGGIVFGPKPKFDQHVRINQKERQAAIRCLIGEKIRAGQFRVIDSTEMSEPKTNKISGLLDKCEIDGRVLFLGEGEYVTVDHQDGKEKVSVKTTRHDNFVKSLRNIPGAEFCLARNINGYDLACARELIVTESALRELEEWLCRE
jgi:large subunit ribosomal protein L4